MTFESLNTKSPSHRVNLKFIRIKRIPELVGTNKNYGAISMSVGMVHDLHIEDAVGAEALIDHETQTVALRFVKGKRGENDMRIHRASTSMNRTMSNVILVETMCEFGYPPETHLGYTVGDDGLVIISKEEVTGNE